MYIGLPKRNTPRGGWFPPPPRPETQARDAAWRETRDLHTTDYLTGEGAGGGCSYRPIDRCFFFFSPFFFPPRTIIRSILQLGGARYEKEIYYHPLS